MDVDVKSMSQYRRLKAQGAIIECCFCERETLKVRKHHVTPIVKGGQKGEVVKCCRTCSEQVHMLFTESELRDMTFDELLNHPKMQKYIEWIKNRSGEFSVKMSNHVKGKRRR